MGRTLFDIKIKHLDGAARVELVGELDLVACEELRLALWPLVARYDGDQLELDCARLRFVDVRATGVLVDLARATAGGSPRLLDPPASLTKILELTGDVACFQHEDTSQLA